MLSSNQSSSTKARPNCSAININTQPGASSLISKDKANSQAVVKQEFPLTATPSSSFESLDSLRTTSSSSSGSSSIGPLTESHKRPLAALDSPGNSPKKARLGKDPLVFVENLVLSTVFTETYTLLKVKSAVAVAKELQQLLKSNEGEDLRLNQEVLNRLNAFFNNQLKEANIHYLISLTAPERQALLEKWFKSLLVRIAATCYQADLVVAGGKKFAVHNRELLPFIREKKDFTLKEAGDLGYQAQYSASRLTEIIDHLSTKGLFTVEIREETGLVRTADAPENEIMNNAQWITDSMYCGLWQQDQHPQSFAKSLLAHVSLLFADEFTHAYKKTLTFPNWYREGAPNNGMPHVYMPESISFAQDKQIFDARNLKLPEKWLNQKRLESQAMLLNELLKGLRQGVIGEGHKDNEFACQQINMAITRLALYLMAVNEQRKHKPFVSFDFNAPSSSSWEEAAFSGGMTLDSALTVLALENLRDLLFKGESLGSLSKTSEALQRNFIGELQSFGFYEVASVDAFKAALDNCIQAGRAKIQENVIAPLAIGAQPIMHPTRPSDTSLLLLAASDYRFVPDNIWQDAHIRLALVLSQQKDLLGPNGMKRYPAFKAQSAKFKDLGDISLHDSYLNANYWMPETCRAALKAPKSSPLSSPKVAGLAFSNDADDVLSMLRRQENSSEHTVAEWSLGLTASLQAVAKARVAVLTALKERAVAVTKRGAAPQMHPTPEEEDLLKKLNMANDEFIRRTLGVISQEALKSTGEICQAYRLLEAYEVVTDLEGKPQYVPGAHPLAWATAAFYDGLKNSLNAAKLVEDLDCLVL